MSKRRNFNVVFLRHAESVNNTLTHDITNPDFGIKRHHDAPLTERGVVQVDVAGQEIVRMDFHPPVSKVLTSYFHRALRTALAVQNAFKEKKESDPSVLVPSVQLWKDIHEFGGCYKTSAVSNDQKGEPSTEVLINSQNEEEVRKTIGLPGRTTAEVLAEFPTYSCRPDEQDACVRGWWDVSADGVSLVKGKETRANSKLRHLQMYHDLCKHIGTTGPEEAESNDATVVVITHGDYYKNFMKVWVDEGWLKIPEGVDAIEPLNNTGITHLRFVSNCAEEQHRSGEGSLIASPEFDVHLVLQNYSEHMNKSGVGCAKPQTLRYSTAA